MVIGSQSTVNDTGGRGDNAVKFQWDSATWVDFERFWGFKKLQEKLTHAPTYENLIVHYILKMNDQKFLIVFANNSKILWVADKLLFSPWNLDYTAKNEEWYKIFITIQIKKNLSELQGNFKHMRA